MAEFEIKNHGGGFLFIKQELRKILSSNPLKGLANARTVVVYNNDIPLASIKKSLEILMNDIDFRLEEEERENNHPDD